MLDRRITAATCALLLLAGACSSGGGGDQVAAEGTAGDDAPRTTFDERALIAENRCDVGVNHETYYEEAETYGVDTLTGSFDTVASMGEIMEGRTADDGHDHEHADEMPEDHGDMSAEEHAQMEGAHEGHDGASDDTGHGGHAGPQPWEALTDQALCDQLEAELDHAYEVAMRYPTLADAKAAGFHLITPYVPGMGSHVMNFGWVDEEFDFDEPEMLLFDGNVDESRIVGLSYYVIKPGEVEPDVGFTGPNDRYHRHLGLCIKGGMVIGAESLTEEQCAAVGGSKADGEGAWMQHTWVVPGCESPWGMFSGLNPVLDWEVVTETGKPGTEGCAASERDYDMSTPGGGKPPTSG